MARIMKIRVIPRGFQEISGLVSAVEDMARPFSAAEFFMGLHNNFGLPSVKGESAYMLRHNNVVLKIVVADKDKVSFGVWVSSGHLQDARRKRVRLVNVVARRLNEKNVAFIAPHDMADNIYFAVRTKNEELIKKEEGLTAVQIRAKMDDNLTEQESLVLYGGIHLFMDGVKEELQNIINHIFYEQ